MRRVVKVTATVVCLSVLAGCGNKESAQTDQTNLQKAKLMLDFTPNAVHTGIYAAKAKHYYEKEGVKLKVQAPSSSTDSVKLLSSGKVDFAVMDIHDLGIAREKGAKLVAVMAVVEKPLAAVITLKKSAIGSPKELVGKEVGVTGLPSDDAVLNSVVTDSGANPDSVKKVTIGFNAVTSLIAGKVTAATSFWNAEGVTLSRRGYPVREFRVDDYGAPSYPELVVVTSEQNLREEEGLVNGVVQATAGGYRYTLKEPKAALQHLTEQVRGLSSELMAAQLKALRSAIQGDAAAVGYLDQKVLEQWGQWDMRFGILKREPDITKAFSSKFIEP